MKTINIRSIINIVKDIFTKACIYFTVLVILLNIGGMFFSADFFGPKVSFMFGLASLFAGMAAQIFKITKIPAISRHIAFFILIYIDMFLIVIPLSSYSTNANSTFYLSVIFTVIYLIILGIYAGIKTVINAVRNKKLKYDEQFKNAK